METFTPQFGVNLTEPWRWREFESLKPYSLHCGAEDHNGILWFANPNGAVSYDGYRCREWPFPESLSGATPYAAHWSDNGYLFIYTSKGLHCLDQGKWEIIKAFEFEFPGRRNLFAQNNHGLTVVSILDTLYQLEGKRLVPILQIDNQDNSIAFNAANKLWVSYRSNDNSEVIASYQFENNALSDPLKKREYKINASSTLYSTLIADPSSEEVWAINWRGGEPAARYLPREDKWEEMDFEEVSGSNAHTGGARINEDTIIIFSKTSALLRCQEEFRVIDYPEFRIPTNLPFTIQRRNGNTIVGGIGEPIHEIDTSSRQWRSYEGLHFQCEGDDKRLWFISLDGSIIEHNSVYDSWSKHIDQVIDTPTSIIRSEDNFIWAAGSHEGIAAISYYDGRKWTRRLHPELGNISHIPPQQLESGEILFGSSEEVLSEVGGLLIYRKSQNSYRSEYYAPPVVPRRIGSIAASEENTLWFGGIGLWASEMNLDSTTQPITPFANDRWIDHLIRDRMGNLWVGIWDKGLFQYKGNEWIHLNSSQKIISNQIAYLMADSHRNNQVWIATNEGVSRFDGENWFRNALPKAIRFNRESGTLKQSTDGTIWINTATRNWFFRRSKQFNITENLHNNFRTIGYRPDTDPPIVDITPFENRFAAPANILIQWQGYDMWSKTPDSDIAYSFRVDESPWSKFEKKKSTILLDTPSGEHVFSVRAMDLDGNISQSIATVAFEVVPPLWQRLWFIILTASGAITIIALIVLLLKQRIRHIIQLEEFKIQFFTNISHELRTPLTVILGPLESQISELPESWNKTPLKLAYRNAQKMLRLIDQLLDFRSADLGNIKINYNHTDFVVDITESIDLIRPLAKEKQQTLTFQCFADSCLAWYDSEKIEKIITNLVGNAIKYTDEGGRISVTAELVEQRDVIFTEIKVEDNGIGIPKGKIDSVFEMFYRANAEQNAKARGSGIGLSYTKTLIEACSGTIEVESPTVKVNGVSQGTRFIVALPLRKTSPSSSKHEAPNSRNREVNDDSSSIDTNKLNTRDANGTLVLIVEDDDDIRSFLVSELNAKYRVLEASDGQRGLEIAEREIPDLILTDIMMPTIDGKELCKRIKTGEATSHIPVLMLTALKSDQHELEGLEKGADDYLTKPIRTPILKKRIHNLLESRSALRRRYQSLKPNFDIEILADNPLDKKFIERVIAIIEGGMNEPLFDVEFLAQKMFMSRMTLYRKFKALTDESPSSFIKAHRMRRAASMLKSGKHSVSEVAYAVGIQDLSYFSATFKKHFRSSPSKYAKAVNQASARQLK